MKSLFIKADGKYLRVRLRDILYVEALRNYVSIHTSGQVHITHLALKQLEEHLPADLFCKTHKSYIIAVDRITSFNHEWIYLDAIQLPVSPQGYELLKGKLHIVSADQKNKKRNGILIDASVSKAKEN